VIDWYAVASGGTALLSGNNTYTTPTLSASTTYYTQARTTAGCLSAARTPVVATVNATSTTITIGRSGGAASQSVIMGTAIRTIVYTASNAATISRTSGSYPTGVTETASGSSFTISGTPSVAHSRIYTLTATAEGCTSSSTAGTLSVVSSLQGAASTRTWIIGAQTWSAPLKKAQTGCTETTNFGSTNPPTVAYYRSSGLYGESGYLYNWKCVGDHAYLLCPSPWHVPLEDDFRQLDKSLGGTGINRNDEDQSWITSKYIVAWGGVYGGEGLADKVSQPGTDAYYWSAYQYYSGDAAGYMKFSTTGRARPFYSIEMYRGMQIRCVK
jgi:uncharacterized protein (TIGR02145 family)